jgi:SNF2 family DNA or RNA helicase
VGGGVGLGQDGTMSVAAREKALMDFEEQEDVAVILMSLKAASVGLNLVCANHVLLLDVWWNPTVEDQAIDRAHRLGQRKTVQVHRFVIKDTIEDNILKLQERKRAMVASAFGEDSDGQVQRSKLTINDLVSLFSSS